MSFQSAIENTTLLKDHLKNGLQALGSNSSKVKPTDTRKCEGSVDIDNAVERKFPSRNRWDYAAGYNGQYLCQNKSLQKFWQNSQNPPHIDV